jgi:enolase-phosphatase E1
LTHSSTTPSQKRLPARFTGIAVVLLDIEGTTTPISFVYDTLFPYARKRLRPFLSLTRDDKEVMRALAMLTEERDADPVAGPSVDLATYVEQLMDRDVKSRGLKVLQGLIWRVGYGSGALYGVVFDDVPQALQQWKALGIRTAIYSSGSVLAQKLIFGVTKKFGDLTPELSAFFDTAVGLKRSPASYAAIAAQLGCDTSNVLFVSDVVAELEAASAAGCQTALIIRPGNPSPEPFDESRTIRSLSELELAPSPAH